MSERGGYVQVLRKNGTPVRYLFRRNGAYYSLFQARGKNIRQKCPYEALADAQKWLADLRAKALGGVPSGTTNIEKMRSEWPTVRQVCDAYLEIAPTRYKEKRKPTPRTARTNVWAFRRMVADLHGTSNPDGLRFSPGLLDDESARRFVVGRLDLATDGDLLVEDRARVTAGSTLAQARSLFARWTRPHYRRMGLRFPDALWRWVESVESHKPRKYARPLGDLIQKTLDGVKELPIERRMAHALVYNFGLRRDEALHARWDWVVPYKDAGRAINIPERDEFGWRGPKSRPRMVPATDDVWRVLESGRSGDYLLPGATQGDRSDLLDALCKWLRERGWDKRRFPKPLHEQRKLAGSIWCQMASPDRAAQWLGDTLGVVLHYYVDFVGQAEPVSMG